MSSLGERTVLAIDPGTSKCGVAAVQRTAEGKIVILERKIVPTESVGEETALIRDTHHINLLIVGGGTNSRPVVDKLREAMPSIGILLVDEKDTTTKARERYWTENPRRGYRRLLPATMWTPPEPVDDYVAVILAERSLSS